MKFRALIIAIVLVATATVNSTAAAKPTAGAKCAKLNSIQISDSKKYTCVLKNKQLVWNSGVAIKPSVVPNAESKQTTISDFADLANNVDLSAETAWKKTIDLSNTGPTPKYELEIIVGPNTKPDVLNPNYSKYSPTEYIDLIVRLYAPTTTLRKTLILYTNYQDRLWAKSKLDEFCGPNNNCSRDFLNFCDDTNKSCGGGLATTNSDYSLALVAIASSEAPWKIYTENIGTTEVHEFTHTIQQAQLTLATANRSQEVPRWFTEGEANLNQLMLSGYYNNIGKYQTTDIKMVAPTFTFGEYQVNRKAQIDMMKNSTNDVKFFQDFLNSPNEIFWQSSPYSQKQTYYYGAMFVESLRALKGPQAEMTLISLIGNGKTFPEAFKTVYGIDWEKAKPILAVAASKKFGS